MVKDFTFLLPTQINFGCGARKEIKKFVGLANIKKPCIVTDNFLVNHVLGKELISTLPDAPVFCEVKPNPDLTTIAKCAQFCRENGCDGLVALGGGSSIDTAKATSVAVAHNKNIEVFLDGLGEKKTEITKSLPIVAIPTTFGTGSEVSQFAVITNEETKRKDSITSSYIYPVYSLIDPEVSYGLPRGITISTGLDVLSHALESLTGNLHNSLTELMAKEAIKIIFKYLPQCFGDNEKVARKEIAFASMNAGIAMSHCCGTLPHGMGCPLSGHCNVPHGLACGVLQIPTLEITGEVCHEKLEELLIYLDGSFVAQNQESAAQIIIEKIKKLFKDLEIEGNLKEFNITDEQIQAMIPDALIHGCTGLTPAEIDTKTIETIYSKLK